MAKYLMLDNNRSVVISKVKSIALHEGGINFHIENDWMIRVEMKRRDLTLAEVLRFVSRAEDEVEMECVSIKMLDRVEVKVRDATKPEGKVEIRRRGRKND